MPHASPEPTPAARAAARFLERLGASLADGTFLRLTLGSPAAAREKAEGRPGAAPLKWLLRLATIRGELCGSATSRFATRDEVKNYPLAQLAAQVAARLGRDFHSAHLFTRRETVQLELRVPGGKPPRLRLLPAEKTAPIPPAENAPQSEPDARPPASALILAHDRSRQRWVDARAPWLAALGVTDAHGKVRERMRDKFRQIERFVDLLASAWRESGLAGERREPGGGEVPAPLRLCDMGSGKGYLTFAACDYLQNAERAPVAVTGVEARGDLVRLCNRVAAECGLADPPGGEAGLRFVESPIAEFPLPRLDLLVALHACDTATDDALAAGVRAGARILLVAPCCHKEARRLLDRAAPAIAPASAHPLADLLRHGLFAERQAEMLTDALRALCLERAGYRVRVAEFVDAGHTAKNVMLIATRRELRGDSRGASHASQADQRAAGRIAALRGFYGIPPLRLERLLFGEPGPM